MCAVSFCITLRTGEYSLFFVRRVGNTYQLGDLYFGRWSVSRLHSISQQAGLAGLNLDLIAGLRDTDERVLLNTVELLAGSDRLESTEPLVERLRFARPRLQAAIYIALLRQNDYSNLAEILGSLEKPSSDGQVGSLQDRILFYIGQIDNAATVPVLLTFATTRSDSLRESVIHALRQTASPKSVPTLVTALDDPIQIIRYDAVFGLATIEQRPNLAPSVDAFEKDPQLYIGAWKSWWLNSGRALYNSVSE